MYGFVETLTEPPTRRHAPRRWNVKVKIQCWSKNRETVAPAKVTAATIAELFRHAVIEVLDYDVEVDPPTLGVVELFEPRISDERDSEQDVHDGYQFALVTVDGFAQET